MIQTIGNSQDLSCDALDQYVVAVRELNSQFHHIEISERETADSLSRAAAALRSMAAAHTEEPSG